MILPIGHEKDSVRRLPWVTFSIIVICLITHQNNARLIKKGLKEQYKIVDQYIHFFIQHPYLKIDPEIEKIYKPDPKERELFKQQMEFNMQYFELPDETIIREQQQDLDIKGKAAKNALSNIPYYHWGHIPNRGGVVTLITYQFLHAPGFWHIFGNLLFLYLMGPFLEDKWGRITYGIFYLLTGMLAALFFGFHFPNSMVPLVGASGAIAGLMGGFLLNFYRIRIKFLSLWGIFYAPAWMMIPLWVFVEIKNTNIIGNIGSSGSGGVAHWAHIWGFVFGFLFALGIKKMGLEKRMEKKLGPEVTILDPGYIKYEEAMGLIDNGNHSEGFSQLMEAARISPADTEIGETLWKYGSEAGKTEEVTPYFTRLIENEIRNNEFNRAFSHLNQLKTKNPSAGIGLQSTIAMVDFLVQNEEIQEAEKTVREILPKLSISSPPGILLQLAPACTRLDPRIRDQIIELVIRHPEISDMQKNEMKNRYELADMSGYRPQSSTAATDHTALEMDSSTPSDKTTPRDGPSPARSIRSTGIIPLEIREDKLVVETNDGKKKLLPLKQIRGISVAKIAPAASSPYYLMDLIMSDLGNAAAPVNCIRMISSQFSPLDIVSCTGNDEDALKVFLSFLLQLSEAEPLPSIEAVLFLKTEEYHDVAAYERTVCSG